MMLSDNNIDELIQPFVERQQSLENYVVGVIAKRVKEVGTMNKSDLHKLERLYQTGSDVRAINEAIATTTGLQVRDIKKLIRYVAASAYSDVRPFYDYRHRSFIPMDRNIPLMRVVEAVSRQTQGAYKNMSNSKVVGFMIRDRKRPTKTRFYNASDAYKSVIDEAIQTVQSGVVDYGTAMRKTMKQLGESGLQTAVWESGYHQRLDSAVRRNILNGVQQIAQQTTLVTGEQFGADGVEITAHEFPAPDHAPFQGHMLTNEEYDKLQSHYAFEDTQGNKFPAQARAITELNCKHLAYPLILAVATPTYTDKQLKDILKRNEKGLTLPNGNHITGYEATQKQNDLALKVRRYKDLQMMAQECGDDVLAKEYQIKVNKATQNYKLFTQQAKSQIGLSDRKDKLTVTGYRRISTK